MFLICLLGGIVALASVYYLITGILIPGVIPIGTALLMIPLWLHFGNKMKNQKLMLLLVCAAFALNMISGIMQLLNS